jgi:hypothetical protein
VADHALWLRVAEAGSPVATCVGQDPPEKYAGGVLATESLLDVDHPAWAVPAPLVALLIA